MHIGRLLMIGLIHYLSDFLSFEFLEKFNLFLIIYHRTSNDTNNNYFCAKKKKRFLFSFAFLLPIYSMFSIFFDLLFSKLSLDAITNLIIFKQSSSSLIGTSTTNWNKTKIKWSPYLQASKRELLADYALPCSVIILSFVGSFVFRDIPGKCTSL